VKVKENGEINASSLDPRKVKFNIAFSIIDRYNTIIRRNENVNNIGRVPSFIDASYVKELLNSRRQQVIRDKDSGEAFLVLTEPLIKGNLVVGAVSVGENINYIYPVVLKYLLFQILVALALLAIAVKLIKTYQKTNQNIKNGLKMPSTIAFDDKASVLILDDNKIKIPYATNQFYFLKSIFSNSSKRWETDELLEKFGELEMKQGNWRKVYDTMVGINKKVENILPVKLVVNQDKTYQLNPELFR
jgi:hypothetical protein